MSLGSKLLMILCLAVFVPGIWADDIGKSVSYRAGFAKGNDSGFAHGHEDAVRGAHHDRDDFDSDNGFEKWMKHKDEYKRGYRAGFQAGYTDGYSGLTRDRVLENAEDARGVPLASWKHCANR